MIWDSNLVAEFKLDSRNWNERMSVLRGFFCIGQWDRHEGRAVIVGVTLQYVRGPSRGMDCKEKEEISLPGSLGCGQEEDRTVQRSEPEAL